MTLKTCISCEKITCTYSLHLVILIEYPPLPINLKNLYFLRDIIFIKNFL